MFVVGWLFVVCLSVICVIGCLLLVCCLLLLVVGCLFVVDDDIVATIVIDIVDACCELLALLCCQPYVF